MDKWYTMVSLMIGMLLIAFYTSSSALEIAATMTGLLSVWLTARENIWCWPVSLINVVCFFFMFFEAKLYADMTLQIVFLLLSVQGWIVWLTKRGQGKVRPTRRANLILLAGLGILLIVVTAGWGYVLTRFTDASIPYVDAFIATLSVVAQILLSNKMLENWLIWIAVDILSIGMYTYKGLYTVAFLYMIFLAIATSGYFSWKKEYRLRLTSEGESALPGERAGSLSG
jgi:nicotinamide mononucleotide transporter